MAADAVAVDGLTLGYGGEPVVRDLQFAVGRGATLCVLGPNGGGKTTLFRALMGDLPPLAGSFTVAGRPSYLAQTDRTRLDFPVTALDVALMGSLASGRWWLPPRRSERLSAQAALERVGLGDEAEVHFGELSGGQRRRALLARALAHGAPVLLLDEPYAGVDPASAEGMANLFRDLREEGHTLLLSTHDVQSARSFDLVLALNGRQVAFGEPVASLGREVLEATYGSDLVLLEDGDEPLHGITVEHHDH